MGVGDVRIVDEQLVAASEQPLCEVHERALPQVVGALLEGQPEQPDTAVPARLDEPERPSDVLVVRRDQVLEDGHTHVSMLGVVDERPHVLGQARATKGEAGSQVGGRDVELRISLEDVHHLVAVDT